MSVNGCSQCGMGYSEALREHAAGLHRQHVQAGDVEVGWDVRAPTESRAGTWREVGASASSYGRWHVFSPCPGGERSDHDDDENRGDDEPFEYVEQVETSTPVNGDGEQVGRSQGYNSGRKRWLRCPECSSAWRTQRWIVTTRDVIR